MNNHPDGLELKKGQLVRCSFPELNGIFIVEKDNEWDCGRWSSVYLVGQEFPYFTHKGGVEILLCRECGKILTDGN